MLVTVCFCVVDTMYLFFCCFFFLSLFHDFLIAEFTSVSSFLDSFSRLSLPYIGANCALPFFFPPSPFSSMPALWLLPKTEIDGCSQNARELGNWTITFYCDVQNDAIFFCYCYCCLCYLFRDVSSVRSLLLLSLSVNGPASPK